MTALATIGWTIAGAAAWMTMAAGVIAVGPDVEVLLSPPLYGVSYANVTRNGQTLCWDLHISKRRGELKRSDYWIDYGLTMTRDHVIVTLDGKPTPVTLEPGVVGAMLGPYCAVLPLFNGHVLVDVHNKDSYLKNVRVYTTNPFWQTILAFPPLLIPREPVKRYDTETDQNRSPCSTCHTNK